MGFINDTLEAIISIFPAVPALLTGPVLTGIAANIVTSAIGTLIKSARHSRRAAKGRKGRGPRHRQ